MIVIMLFSYYCVTYCYVCFFFRTCNKVISLNSEMINFGIFVCLQDLSYLHYSFICPIFWLATIVVQVTFCSSKLSQSSISRSVGLFLGTSKKLCVNFTTLCLIVAIHMPNCVMLELLYACNLTFCLYNY